MSQSHEENMSQNDDNLFGNGEQSHTDKDNTIQNSDEIAVFVHAPNIAETAPEAQSQHDNDIESGNETQIQTPIVADGEHEGDQVTDNVASNAESVNLPIITEQPTATPIDIQPTHFIGKLNVDTNTCEECCECCISCCRCLWESWECIAECGDCVCDCECD
eukprot:Seg1779.8 transcript_id=Seg1779.8/GoldUCD/mRNA.D3Y31 product="hypothetical protein" protein_id=Seg1779.8/GoldUCD/D3Y31